jgi:sugar lactone lactonase YvrE
MGQARSQTIYWTDVSSGEIKRLDSTGVTTLVSELSNPTGIAVDTTGMVYWTDSGSGDIKRLNLNGTVTTLVSGLSVTIHGNGIALDAAHELIYWTDTVKNHPVIRRASSLDGSGQTTLFTLSNSSPRGLALDLAGGKMYWTAWNLGQIQQANLDGSGKVTTLVKNLNILGYVALDVPNDKMYWASAGGDNIGWANLDGSLAKILISNLPTPYGIALLDPSNGQGHIYWTDNTGGEIWRANLDGSGAGRLITGLPGPYGIAVAP